MPKPDKRSRLIETATDRVHAQGFNQTTLADVAEQADVPLGNVYYYFKTKQALGESVIDTRRAQYQSARDDWDKLPEPKQRLKAFVRMTLDNRKLLVERGCPIGTLCAELHKEHGPLADAASDLFTEFLDWLTQQFKALGQ
ncbi:MAG: TetR/AcrR family transcriptional regulator, partial [Polyangiaceae bacterium]